MLNGNWNAKAYSSCMDPQLAGAQKLHLCNLTPGKCSDNIVNGKKKYWLVFDKGSSIDVVYILHHVELLSEFLSIFCIIKIWQIKKKNSSQKHNYIKLILFKKNYIAQENSRKASVFTPKNTWAKGTWETHGILRTHERMITTTHQGTDDILCLKKCCKSWVKDKVTVAQSWNNPS